MALVRWKDVDPQGRERLIDTDDGGFDESRIEWSSEFDPTKGALGVTYVTGTYEHEGAIFRLRSEQARGREQVALTRVAAALRRDLAAAIHKGTLDMYRPKVAIATEPLPCCSLEEALEAGRLAFEGDE